MSDARKQIAEVMGQSLSDCYNREGFDENNPWCDGVLLEQSDLDIAADAILAAMPDIVRGMVKPLVWGDVEWGEDEYGCQQWEEFNDHLTTMTECNSYAIYKHDDGKFMWTRGDHDNMRYSTYRPMGDPDWVPVIPWHPSEQAAQQAAQDHHAAQLLAGLNL